MGPSSHSSRAEEDIRHKVQGEVLLDHNRPQGKQVLGGHMPGVVAPGWCQQ